MKKLIIHGDPGIRKGARIEVDNDEFVCFGINRQGEYHGPDRIQLWCTVGSEDERATYETREYIPMHLETESVDAENVTIVDPKGTVTAPRGDDSARQTAGPPEKKQEHEPRSSRLSSRGPDIPAPVIKWGGALFFSVLFGGFLGFVLTYGEILGALLGILIVFGLFALLYLRADEQPV